CHRLPLLPLSRVSLLLSLPISTVFPYTTLFRSEVDGTSYTFDNCVIATGSVVKTLPGVELSENVVSYEEQILSRDIPGSMVIVGAGAIGMEFAYILANYGVDVTMVEFMDRALPNEDEEVSKE